MEEMPRPQSRIAQVRLGVHAAERLEGFDRNWPTTQLLADDAKLGKQLLVREHASLPVAAAFYLHRSVRPDQQLPGPAPKIRSGDGPRWTNTLPPCRTPPL